jgi:probable poly-beta-1,6-N-acetyl-D-glucosamine export protein
VLLPYLVVSIPALIGSLTIYDQGMVAGFDQQPLLMKIWLFLETGKHLAPLWFVPTITLIFLVAPLLLWVDTRRWPYLSLLLLIPLSAWLGRDGLLVQLGLNGNWSPVAKAAYLLSAYIFGMGCSRYYAQAIAFVAHWKWPLLGAVLALFALTALNTGAIHKSGLFSYKILAAPLLLYALSRPQAAWIDRLSLLGHASFGIFFVHCYFLVAIKMGLGLIGLPPLLPGSVVSVLAMTTLVLALSLLALQAAQTLLGRSCRYLVGCNMPRTAPRDSVLTPTEVIVALR